MAIRNRFSELLPEITAWRRDIHENPELLFETHRTSQFVADRLAEFGCDEIVTGIGRTGVVALIKGRSDSQCSSAISTIDVRESPECARMRATSRT